MGRVRDGSEQACTRTQAQMPTLRWEMTMRILASALIALSILAGIVAPASAFDAKSYFEQQQRNLP
jgi:hypothetical protein